MLNTVYVIPGWGFSSKIFNHFKQKNMNFIGLDYRNIEPDINRMALTLNNHIHRSTTLIAWSFGGLVGIQIAALYPEKIKKLILISMQPKFLSDKDWIGTNHILFKKFYAQMKRDFHTHCQHFIDLVLYPNKQKHYRHILMKYFLQNNAEHLCAQLIYFAHLDLRKAYQSLSSELIHIINRKDAVTKQNASQLIQLNPNANIITLDKIGHAGFLTNPDLYQTIVKRYVYA